MHIQLLIHHYGYFGVFSVLLLEMVGIPFPAETTLTLSGAEWTQGVFHLIPLLFAATFGNAIGSIVAYLVGRLLSRPVIVRFGKYVGITSERLDKANLTFQKYETTVVLFSKFVAGIRVLVPYLAGINKMSFVFFTFCTTVSALVWSAVFIILGRYLGGPVTRLREVHITALQGHGLYHLFRHRNQRRIHPDDTMYVDMENLGADSGQSH